MVTIGLSTASPMSGTEEEHHLHHQGQTQQPQSHLHLHPERPMYQPYETRPSTIAAKEFFHGTTANHFDWKSLPNRVERLCQVLREWDRSAKEGTAPPTFSYSFSMDPAISRRQTLTAAVMAHAHPSFLHAFQRLFQQSLQSRQQQQQQQQQLQQRNNEDYEEEEQEESNAMTTTTHLAIPEELTLFQNIRSLGWIQHYGLLQQPLRAALHETLLTWIRNTISREFEQEGLYNQVQEYQQQIVRPWLQDLVGEQSLQEDEWTLKIQYSCAECFCLVRNEQIFELVAEYPDSHPAVLELKQVLEQTQMYSQLGQALKQSLIKRLNHPGAGTNQIIDVYINTIKVLREIDPSDRLLQIVAEPVRRYLRCRHNTVRCIITSLTDAQVGGELYEELRRQDARPLEHNMDDSDVEEEEPDLNWQPPPPISKQKGTFFGNLNTGGGGNSGGADILSMLVSIYGSKELFVNEYRLMLADKLLANLDFNTDKEVHTLELLKLRFGELSMRNCEIMIKDTDDSKRVLTNIHNTLKAKHRLLATAATADDSIEEHDPTRVDAAIVSHIFWPTLQNEQFKHHPRLQADLDEFAAEYARLKNPRRLVWLNQLGTVQLELDVLEELQDGSTVLETREFNVSPLLATLISHFEDKEEWTAEDLGNETGMPELTIKKRMAFWTSHRVLQLRPPSTYVVATREYLIAGGDENVGIHALSLDDDGFQDQAVSVAAQEEEDLAIYESYICGMLNSQGQLPLERIHNMLKMFVTGSDTKYNKTQQQLSYILQHLCKQDKLECGPDGMYKLVKKT